MPFHMPERPHYKRERILAGYLILIVFALLFTVRLLGEKFGVGEGSFFFKFLCEIAIFLLPSLIFLKLRGGNRTQELRLTFPRGGDIPFLLAAFLALFSGSLLLSVLSGGVSSLGNTATSYESAATDPAHAALSVLILAILPAIFEEFFFRGILVEEYERRGAIRAVLMSALFFALSHFDLRNLAVYLFSGVLFALVLFTTDSLFATVLLHMVYNIVSLFGQRYLTALFEFTGSLELFLFLLILILLLSILFFCRGACRRYRARDKKEEPTPRRAVPWQVQCYTILDALADKPILAALLLSVVGFILF